MLLAEMVFNPRMDSALELKVLGACAVPRAHARQQALLASLIEHGVRWEELVTLASTEGMSGLAWEHLQSFALVPAKARRALAGLQLRQRHVARVQETVLGHVLEVAESVGVDVMLLKGAAVRRLVYPDPELRPMRDMDVLVRRGDVLKLHQALCDAGFERRFPDKELSLYEKSLPDLGVTRDGIAVNVEIHQALYQDLKLGFDELARDAKQVEVLGKRSLLPSRVEMLRHVYVHGMRARIQHNVDHFRLVAVADLVCMVEAFCATLDWSRLRRADRRLTHALTWLDALAPLSDAARAYLEIPSSRPRVGEHYVGWPVVGGKLLWRELLSRSSIKRSFFPSPWWLSVRYGLAPRRVALLWAHVRHAHELFAYWLPTEPIKRRLRGFRRQRSA